MEPARGNRKVLPNYLLDDYVPSPESKVSSSSQGAHDSSLQAASAGPSHQHLDNGSAAAGESNDNVVGSYGFLPRRKKKLRQACVYCRRSHLVCEEKRPCHRCVKRGIADRCVDPPQEAALLQDAGWQSEAGSSTSTSKDAFVSPPPPLPSDRKKEASSTTSTSTDLSAAEGGLKRKRKAKSDGPRVSTPAQPLAHDTDSRSDYGRPHGAFEFAMQHPRTLQHQTTFIRFQRRPVVRKNRR